MALQWNVQEAGLLERGMRKEGTMETMIETTAEQTTITITCTFGELVIMDSNGQAIYAIPTMGGGIAACYMADRPAWQQDFLLATVENFAEEEGWTSLGWEEMSEDDIAAAADDRTSITLTIQREAIRQGLVRRTAD